MRIAIIPARGGSKRITNKNIKLFNGKPIIHYAINAAILSNIFDRVIVSTDDEEIAKVAKEQGAEVPFMRPTSLADDYTPTVPVISHAIKACHRMGWEVIEACCIYPAVPFISIGDLRIAYEKLMNTNHDFVFPVTQFPSPIQRALRRSHNGTVSPFHPEHVVTRTQDLEPSYFDVGQFYWGKSSSWLNKVNIHQNSTTLVIPEWRSVDIDTLADWKRAELLYAAIVQKVKI